ncbi:MAG: hypothetical protein EBR82_87110 [Caulobacteraceae bacterium]|nr:hypothetical protein [Caulobacteraceae bacterium]
MRAAVSVQLEDGRIYAGRGGMSGSTRTERSAANNRKMEYPAAGRLAPYESLNLPLGAPRRSAPRYKGEGDDGTGAFLIQ